MTSLADLPLPTDWPRRKLITLSAIAHVLLIGIAVRHLFIDGHRYGEFFYSTLNLLEALGLIAFTLTAGIAFGRTVQQASSLEIGFLWRGGALLTLLALLAPPFLSSDVFDYVARGYVAVLGHNPYTTTAQSLTADPVMADFAAKGHAEWTFHLMPYGPITAALQWLVALFGSPWLAIYAWKLLCALCHLATSGLLLQTMRVIGSERDARRTFVLWLWNPWILLECCGSAHNEAFVVLGIAAMGLALAKSRFFATALAPGAMILVKHGSAPLSLLLFITACWQKQRMSFLLGAALAIAVTLGCYSMLWSGPKGLDWITSQQHVAQGSLPSLLGEMFGDFAKYGALLFGLVALTVVCLAGVQRCKDATSFGRFGALSMSIFVLLLMPNFAPWYQFWWLPLFVLTQLPLLSRVLELLAWTGPLSYLVFAGTHDLGALHQAWALLLAGIWPTLLLMLDWRNLTGIHHKSPVATAAVQAPNQH